MTRKGQLTIVGTQLDGSGEEQTARIAAAADYHTADGSIYILYEEDTAEGEGTTRNMIKLKGGALELTKKGAVSARMVFEPGQEHMTLYSTPFGALPLGICTDTVESALSEEEFRICASYSLTSQGCPISHCRILIKFLFQG